MGETSQEGYAIGEAQGRRDVWVALLKQALQHLGYASETLAPERLRHIVEREEAIAMLRECCATWGDNDWPAHLHLADIIDKHLWRHLERGMVHDR